MSTILCAHIAYFNKSIQTHFPSLLHQTLRISSAANVINSRFTKRRCSERRYEAFGWLNNGSKPNRVHNTLRPYRILEQINSNSFPVSLASNASYIIVGERYKLPIHEATMLRPTLRGVRMVKQRLQIESCPQYFAPISHTSRNQFKLICCRSCVKRFVYYLRRTL